MGQTLTHGVYLPDEGERNCYNGLAGNWTILDGAVGTIAEHTSALSGKAPLVHTHTKSDITDFPALATVATSGSYNDLSNIPASFTPSSHTHGNITNDGKVGTAANVPLITGTDGVVQAGSFGTSANTFCEGNDSRLSDARTPVAHTHTKSDVTDLFNSANTWTGDNTFSNTLNVQTGYTLGTLPQAESAVALFTGRTIDNNFVTNINFYQNPTRGTGLRFTIRNKWDNNGYSTTGTTRNAHFELLQSINKTAYMQWEGYVNNGLYPLANNTYDLGSSSYKWKTLNGINPGALSLPNLDATIGSTNDKKQDISGDLVPDSYNNARFTARIPGWVYIDFNVSNATISPGTQMLVQFKDSNLANATFAINFERTPSTNHILIYVPVIANRTYVLELNFTGQSIEKAYVIPCFGNV